MTFFRAFAVIAPLLILSAMAYASNADENKKTVTSFYNLSFVDHKPSEAADLYIGKKYIQHNPYVPDGKKAFTDYFVPFFKQHPDAKSEIKHAAAEGDLVFLHVFDKKDKSDRGKAVVDIFRVENGKIVEHWDVMQEIPEKAANQNTMF